MIKKWLIVYIRYISVYISGELNDDWKVNSCEYVFGSGHTMAWLLYPGS